MTFEQLINTYHLQLNTQQTEAVQSVEGPVLLLAVPGSGKTTVLVTRLGYMIYCLGLQPESILTVTYTVAATKDMAARFVSFFGDEFGSRLEFRTINGICAKVIQQYGNKVGKSAFQLQTDEKYLTALVAGIYRECTGEFPTESDIKTARTWITYIKNMMLTKQEIKALSEEEDLPLSDIYERYCGEMRRQSFMDYDDQMVYAYTILKKSPEMLALMQNQYRYICVDEAQDTSKIQHGIIALLASREQNLFMVGDEDQSIYGFRAAYPEALLSFEKHYSNAKVLLMEENFRSAGKIVTAADDFIQKNTLRHAKHMKATREPGAEIKELHVGGRRAQYGYLLKVAADCDRQTAVLYRDNESILPLIDLLERENISYRMKNGDLTFFSHRVIVDIENIIRFGLNPGDTELFMQIYYKLGTYLNKNAALAACEISRQGSIPVLEAALGLPGLPQGTRKSCKSIQTHLEGMLTEKADKAVYRIVQFMGYGNFLERSNIKDSKVEILKSIAAQELNAEALLHRMDQLEELVRDKKPDWDSKFILSTIHSSKGLEYDRVYMLDVLDGIFPENIPMDQKHAEPQEWKEYEEERRLFYVGATRARDELALFTFPLTSTFSKELLHKSVIAKGHGSTSNRGIASSSTGAAGPSYLQKTRQKKISQEEYADAYTTVLRRGKLTHKLYGEGQLLEHNGDYVTVEFEGQQKVLSMKVLLEKGLLVQ